MAFSCPLIERRNESADAFVAAGGTCDDEVPHRQGRAGGVVVLTPVGHFGVPEKRSGVAVQRDHVSVIGDHEQAVSGNRDSAVHSPGRVAYQPLRSRPLISPDLPPAARVERPALVCAGDVHHAANDDGRHLQAGGIRQREHPLRREPLDVASIDLRQRAVPAAVRPAVVRRPVGLRCHFAVRRPLGPQQVNALRGPKHLQIPVRLVQHQAFERSTRRQRHAPAGRRLGATRAQRPHEGDEVGHFVR